MIRNYVSFFLLAFIVANCNVFTKPASAALKNNNAAINCPILFPDSTILDQYKFTVSESKN